MRYFSFVIRFPFGFCWHDYTLMLDYLKNLTVIVLCELNVVNLCQSINFFFLGEEGNSNIKAYDCTCPFDK